MQLLKVIFLFVLLAALLIIGATLYKNSNNKSTRTEIDFTPRRNIYTNEKYRYRAAVPTGWQVSSHSNNEVVNATSSAHFHKDGTARNQTTNIWPGFTVYVVKNESNLPLSQIEINLSNHDIYPTPNDYKFKQVVINNTYWEEANRALSSNSNQGYLRYSTSKNGYLFYILEFNGQYDSELDYVLKTFEFF